uniref:Uncharacterized protein n=1 Tax=Arundo donax TaxID=35708 RepID=A0A0A9GQV7_ARUDO
MIAHEPLPTTTTGVLLQPRSKLQLC